MKQLRFLKIAYGNMKIYLNAVVDQALNRCEAKMDPDSREIPGVQPKAAPLAPYTGSLPPAPRTAAEQEGGRLFIYE